jgi:ribosome-associated protein
LDSHDLTRRIAELALGKKAEDVLVLDVRQSSLGTDWFLICSGNSDVHVKAIADEIVERLKEKDERVWRVEGYSAGRWILLDYVDVVVHVFHRDTRGYFGLELLWGDVPCERLED